MKKAAAAAVVLLALVPMVVVLALSGGRSASCPVAAGGAPVSGLSILGPATVDQAALEAFWDSKRSEQPERLGAPIDDVIAMYLRAGKAEGVRGDVAFVQSLIETGWFTNSDTSRHNYAGIAHYDDAPAGKDFPSPEAGVTGQIQLLKRYAAGNDVELVLPDYAPRAGASAVTWEQLSGKWATATTYGATILKTFNQVLAGAGQEAAAESDCKPAEAPGGVTIDPSGELATVRGITVAVEIAPQTAAMIDAAAAAGLTLTGGGYRDPAEQIALRKAHCGSSYYAIYQMPSSSCRPPTARPGTSQHELGLAIDFRCNGRSIGQHERSNPCVVWLTANAGRYGFKNLPSEAWHWSAGPKAGS